MPSQCRRPCHYCGGTAGTKDHVVPRVLLDRTQRFLGQITNNSVPACSACNQAKGAKRVVDCCAFCHTRWEMYGPPGWFTVTPTITLAEVVGERGFDVPLLQAASDG